MRIGIDIRELQKGRMTGIGRYLRNFIDYASQARPDHSFVLYGNQHTDTTLARENVSVTIVRERWTIWWDQITLPSLACGDRLELFLSPYIKGPGRICCPLVTTIHDLLFLDFPQYNNCAQRFRNTLFKRIV